MHQDMSLKYTLFNHLSEQPLTVLRGRINLGPTWPLYTAPHSLAVQSVMLLDEVYICLFTFLRCFCQIVFQTKEHRRHVREVAHPSLLCFPEKLHMHNVLGVSGLFCPLCWSSREQTGFYLSCDVLEMSHRTKKRHRYKTSHL